MQTVALTQQRTQQALQRKKQLDSENVLSDYTNDDNETMEGSSSSTWAIHTLKQWDTIPADLLQVSRIISDIVIIISNHIVPIVCLLFRSGFS